MSRGSGSSEESVSMLLSKDDTTMTTNGSTAHASLPEADPVQRPARLAMYVGVALIAVGAIVLYLGYNGAATNAIPAAQFPYLISGGIVGACLMILGSVVIAMHVLLRVQAELRKDLGEMRSSLDSVAQALGRVGAVAGASVTSTNGTVMVARGASSFHRPECRLVSRAEDVRPVARAEADGSGLLPCRICKP